MSRRVAMLAEALRQEAADDRRHAAEASGATTRH
jgi:hypothetical protein